MQLISWFFVYIVGLYLLPILSQFFVVYLLSN